MNRKTRFMTGMILGGALFGSAATMEIPENIDDFEFTEDFAHRYTSHITQMVNNRLEQDRKQTETIGQLQGFLYKIYKQIESKKNGDEEVNVEELPIDELYKVFETAIHKNGAAVVAFLREKEALSSKISDLLKLIDDLKGQLTVSHEKYRRVKTFIQTTAKQLARLDKQ